MDKNNVCEIISRFATRLVCNNSKTIEDIKQDENEKYISVSDFYSYINEVKDCIVQLQKAEEQEQILRTPIKKFLFIEDGSVDIGELQERMENSNPEIKIVIYRQGSNIPMLIDNNKEN